MNGHLAIKEQSTETKMIELKKIRLRCIIPLYQMRKTLKPRVGTLMCSFYLLAKYNHLPPEVQPWSVTVHRPERSFSSKRRL